MCEGVPQCVRVFPSVGWCVPVCAAVSHAECEGVSQCVKARPSV